MVRIYKPAEDVTDYVLRAMDTSVPFIAGWVSIRNGLVNITFHQFPTSSPLKFQPYSTDSRFLAFFVCGRKDTDALRLRGSC